MENSVRSTRSLSRYEIVPLPLPSLPLFGLDAMSELMVYNPWCESEIHATQTGIYIYIGISERRGSGSGRNVSEFPLNPYTVKL